MRPNNITPQKAAKFVQEHNWKFENREGSHETYSKNINGRVEFLQIIYNCKTIYWKNAKLMIKKSGIPEKEWLENC